MADCQSDVRVEERLRIKIGEAKNLLPRSHGSVGSRDSYCAISLDQEEIFRTSTSEKTLSPFFGEEFQFEVPRKFRFLSLYIYDRDRPMKQDKVIGKVAIKKEDLPKYHGKDHWFPIVPVDADSEVQGKVHVDIRLERGCKSNNMHLSKIVVRIIESNDLTIINGSCDPFASITLWCGPHKQETKRTRVRKKTVCPHYNEEFVFEVQGKKTGLDRDIYSILEEDLSNTEIQIAFWHDSGGVFGNTFLGEVKILLQGLDLTKGHNAWYFLQPRDNSKTMKTELGSLRLKIHYISDHIFSSHVYEPLRNLILQSPEVEPITSSSAYILGEIVSNKTEAAQPLIRIFMKHNLVVELIHSLAKWEISQVTDSNIIFRGNSLVSKCMDEFMKLAGHHYLRDTLKGSLEQIFNERKPCEIDPSKLKEGENIEINMLNLLDYVDRILKTITGSAILCPSIMSEVFSELKEIATTYFPDNKEVRYSVVSGFIFLRFFAPAILGPKLFELCAQPIDTQTNRTLTLISKTIQSVGNLVSSKSPQQIFKEDYMISMYKDFITEKHINAVRVFLEIISSSSSVVPRKIDMPILLKEGMMIKRAQGRKKFGIKNFKRRYFSLTTQELLYSRNKGEEALCRIPINHILAVEKLQEESFKMKNMFQVIQPERALYIQANNCVEEKEWIDILAKVCQTNKNRLKEYHPGAFMNGHWLCCKSSNELTPGCCPVTASVPADIEVNIDSDREIERIHTLFLSNMSKLESLLEACESQAVYTGLEKTQQQIPGFVIEDTKSLFKNLQSIIQCVNTLEQEHKAHLRNVYRQTKYGSEQAPIGDDNYLRMAAQSNRL